MPTRKPGVGRVAIAVAGLRPLVTPRPVAARAKYVAAYVLLRITRSPSEPSLAPSPQLRPGWRYRQWREISPRSNRDASRWPDARPARRSSPEVRGDESRSDRRDDQAVDDCLRGMGQARLPVAPADARSIRGDAR